MNNLQLRIKNKLDRILKKSYVNSRYLFTNKDFILSRKFKNYHLGCGELLVTNFLNIDMYSFGEYLPALPLTKDFRNIPYFYQYNLKKGIPASSNSLEIIYHSHLKMVTQIQLSTCHYGLNAATI